MPVPARRVITLAEAPGQPGNVPREAMILKRKDSLHGTVARLEETLRGSLTYYRRNRLERQLAQIRSGIKGEEEAAYHIDFALKDGPNWMVIHDLRLEWNGRVAQIDHLILDRCLEAYVVESKNFGTKVRYANGGWERLAYNCWEGIACPVEQNERHILVLRQLIKDCALAPTRMGMPMPVTFFNMVIVAPSCSIVGKFPRNAHVCRMDKLMERIGKDAVTPLSLLKVVSQETLLGFATKLVGCHKPANEFLNFAAGEGANPRQAACLDNQTTAKCNNCGATVTRDEAYFCRINKDRFAGKMLCQPCQQFAPKVVTLKKSSVRCEACRIEVESNVAIFCERNPKTFGSRILCRKCQTLARMAAA